LPDFHHPHINRPAVSAVFQFIKWFKPHAINILGDAMNMDAVNHWKMAKKAKKYFEGKRLIKEYREFDEEILTPLEKLLPRDCEKTFMGGNHEYWIDTLIEKLPTFEEMIEVETSLRLEERGWEWIPWIKYDEEKDSYTRGIKKYGKLLVFHGQYWNKYHSAKTVDNYSRSCAYAHTHDIQSYTKITADDYKDFHTAQSIGCLCNTSPEFLKGRMNRWVNAFGVLYVREDGMYNLYVPVIINGKFTFEGRVFGEKHILNWGV
jgi:hypothetical protein